jgi:RNA polymerase subunit RPABC4/transcription elongation factor Spt4
MDEYVIPCPACSESIPQSAKFCPQCGTKITNDDQKRALEKCGIEQPKQAETRIDVARLEEEGRKAYEEIYSPPPGSISSLKMHCPKCQEWIFQAAKICPFCHATISNEDRMRGGENLPLRPLVIIAWMLLNCFVPLALPINLFIYIWFLLKPRTSESRRRRQECAWSIGLSIISLSLVVASYLIWR